MNNNGTGISQDPNITNALSYLRFCFNQDARAHARESEILKRIWPPSPLSILEYNEMLIYFPAFGGGSK